MAKSNKNQTKAKILKGMIEESTGKKVVLEAVNPKEKVLQSIKQDGGILNIPFDLKYDTKLPQELKILLPSEVYDKAQRAYDKLTEKWYIAYERDRNPSQGYYDGVNTLQRFLVKQLIKAGYKVEAEEGDDDNIELSFS